MTDRDLVLECLDALARVIQPYASPFAVADVQLLALRIREGDVQIVTGKAAPLAPGASASLESDAPSRDPGPPPVPAEAVRRAPPTLMGLLASYAKANHPGLASEGFRGVDSPIRVTPVGEASDAIFTGEARAADEVQIEPWVPRLCACIPLASAPECLRIRYASHPVDSEARRHELADSDECECVCHAEQADDDDGDGDGA